VSVIANIKSAFGRGGVELSANIIAPWLPIKRGMRVVDVGCGDGTWLSCLPTGCHKTGLDRHRKVRPDSMGWYHRVDFEREWNMPNADVALCLELAEHLTPNAGMRLVGKLAKAARVIVWSAAMPRQGGWGHKNEQWPSYWLAAFAQFDFEPNYSVQDKLWDNADILPWYHHIVVLRQAPSDPRHDHVHPRLANHRSLSRLCALLK
jgi:hypothetical protein